ncbi:50S ribosomal protein L17 [Mycoplasma sp. CSL10137]|uniref:50S ribosomal protein L17 n=1 Tax=unclassified Mycoplasma TaxID=2683645 RepID=UPI0015830173|nr:MULTISPECIES: 50S ribosomal protein L17 [unclassified Mycoplasma]MBN4083764.1 50S ribosomal protein L17 [Mycoplasma sp. CSL10137]MBN4084168.1 50S ribosomal protein L17 [Mycoplasma sp. CSL10166]MBU4692631.1 50S ribosomal protein L17 [Mycoplasma sp. CSL7491-lung]MCU4706379.1 50S ribosomal protein L17 [Mycoplasma sp. CSL7503-lung]QKT05640.1 50S ribosomal protein L17 [Mycoplasma sp. OR1901]
MANPKQIYSRNTKWRNGVMRSLTSELFANGHLTTTLTRAKELRKHAEKMITKAKNPTLANVRVITSYVRPITVKNSDKKVYKHLIDTIAPKYKERQGGYTRIIKLPKRLGDNTRMAIIELVD